MPNAKTKIKELKAYEIINSSGQATLEIEVVADSGKSARTAYPFDNFSTNFSAEMKNDNDKSRYGGKGCIALVEQVNKILSPKVKGMDLFSQKELDQVLEETKWENDKSLDVSIKYCFSISCAKLSADLQNMDLYQYIIKTYKLKKLDSKKSVIPIFNIFNGGDTGDTDLDFQEFLLIPKKEDASEMIRKGAEVFLELAKVLREAGHDTDTGQEGGYAPDMDSSIEAIEFILSAIIRAGYNPGKDFSLGIDIGSSILYDKSTAKYVFSLDKSYFSALDLESLYQEWLSKYPITYLEDVFNESDWESWKKVNDSLGDRMQIVADDLLSSNTNRLRESLNKNSFNSVILKPAKLGTLTKVVEYANIAQEYGYKLLVSGLNQELSDSHIADIAVALGADSLKAGSLSRGERVVKYNRLIEIQNNLK